MGLSNFKQILLLISRPIYRTNVALSFPVGNDNSGVASPTTDADASNSYNPATPLAAGEYIDARDHIQANHFDGDTDAVILLVNNANTNLLKVDDNYDELWDGTIQTAINNTEAADGIDAAEVWTGSNKFGEALRSSIIVDAYAGNTFEASFPFPTSKITVSGNTSSTDERWFSLSAPSQAQSNDTAYQLYGISELIENPNYSAAVPEPSTYLMLGSTLLFAGYARNHRRKKIAVIRN